MNEWALFYLWAACMMFIYMLATLDITPKRHTLHHWALPTGISFGEGTLAGVKKL